MSVYESRGLNPDMKKAAFLILAGLVLILAPFFGASSSFTPNELVFGEGAHIFWQLRAPRVLLGFFAGAALSVCGLVFQSLFRNPLASPYTLGVSGGASFGAVLAIQALGIPVFLGGLFGALLATGLVYLIFRIGQVPDGTTMLLSGVVVSFFFSSLVLSLQYLSNINESFAIVRWLMGGLEVVDFTVPLVIGIVAVGFLVFLFSQAYRLDCMLTGEELAYARGVDVERFRIRLFLVCSLVTGLVVSFTGPIGFVGIMVPHISRSLFGALHKELLVFTPILGGVFLVASDTLARVLLAPAEIPVGVITALLGGPFFLALVIGQKKAG